MGFRKETVISRRRFGKSPIFLWKNVTLLDTIMFATHHHNAVYTTTRCLRSSQKASSRRKALVPTRRPTHTPKKSRVDAAVAATGASKSFCSSAFLCPFYWGNFGSIRDDVVGVQEESSLSLSLSVLQSVRAPAQGVFSERRRRRPFATTIQTTKTRRVEKPLSLLFRAAD